MRSGSDTVKVCQLTPVICRCESPAQQSAWKLASHGCALLCFTLHTSLCVRDPDFRLISDQDRLSVFMVLITEVVLCEQVWVLGQRGADLLLLLEAS